MDTLAQSMQTILSERSSRKFLCFNSWERRQVHQAITEYKGDLVCRKLAAPNHSKWKLSDSFYDYPIWRQREINTYGLHRTVGKYKDTAAFMEVSHICRLHNELKRVIPTGSLVNIILKFFT